MIILDSDIFTLYAYGHANVKQHFDAVPEDEELAITIITRMEILKGRTDSVLKAADETQLRVAADRHRQTEEMLGAFLVAQIEHEAIRHFGSLRKLKKLNKMKRPDMMIACISLAQKALLVTRNTK